MWGNVASFERRMPETKGRNEDEDESASEDERDHQPTPGGLRGMV